MIELVKEIGTFIYIYCTDFVINLANLTGLSYYEINAFIFVVAWPIITGLLFVIYAVQKIRLALILKSKKRSKKRKLQTA